MNHRHYMQVMPGIHCVKCHVTYCPDKIATVEDTNEHDKNCKGTEYSECTPACGNYYHYPCPACGQDVRGK